MIEPKLFTVERLLAMLLDDSHGNRDRWRKFAEIVPDYMPPFPTETTRPKCVVRYSRVGAEDTFLRFSRGPAQGHFWDAYGEDYQTPELALQALLEAPVPPGICKVSEWESWNQQEQHVERERQSR